MAQSTRTISMAGLSSITTRHTLVQEIWLGRGWSSLSPGGLNVEMARASLFTCSTL